MKRVEEYRIAKPGRVVLFCAVLLLVLIWSRLSQSKGLFEPKNEEAAIHQQAVALVQSVKWDEIQPTKTTHGIVGLMTGKHSPIPEKKFSQSVLEEAFRLQNGNINVIRKDREYLAPVAWKEKQR